MKLINLIMKKINKLTLNNIIILFLFFIGLVFCCTYSYFDVYESFNVVGDCPNILLRKGKELHLINSRKPMIPGVNPIKFKNLEEYVKYFEWNKKTGVTCPILYFQETYNTQGKLGVRLLDDPVDPNAGLKSTPPIHKNIQKLTNADRDDPPFNKNQYAGYDKLNQNNGVETPLDQI